jgi:hypothetical protein
MREKDTGPVIIIFVMKVARKKNGKISVSEMENMQMSEN